MHEVNSYKNPSFLQVDDHFDQILPNLNGKSFHRKVQVFDLKVNFFP